MEHVCTHNHNDLVANAANLDPTRTTTLRNAFARAMRVKFVGISRLTRKAIVDKDCFGFNVVQTHQTLPAQGAWAWLTSQEKIDAFMAWLEEQVRHGIIDVGWARQLGRAIQGQWTDMYIEDSYKRGVIRARYELIRAGYDIPSIIASGGIAAAMGAGFHLDRVGVLFSRVFSDLRGITDAMDMQISRVLAQGMIDGDGMALLAKKLQQVIEGGGADLGITDTLGRWIPAKRRAEMLARTEIIRAHHLATIQEYRNWGVVGVYVDAEWRTAGDDRVCDICKPLNRRVFTLDEIEDMIPAHPNCRCLALPIIKVNK